jgi:hypothetical protein
MGETCILIGLLRMYFPRNWEFGSALSKLGISSGGGGEFKPPTPRRYTPGLNGSHQFMLASLFKGVCPVFWLDGRAVWRARYTSVERLIGPLLVFVSDFVFVPKYFNVVIVLYRCSVAFCLLLSLTHSTVYFILFFLLRQP